MVHSGASASIPSGGSKRRLSAKPHCPMPSTCEAVGQCLYPQNACLLANSAANDVPDAARRLSVIHDFVAPDASTEKATR